MKLPRNTGRPVHHLAIVFFAVVMLVGLNADADTSVKQTLSQISAMPPTFYSQQAYDYYTGKGMTLPLQMPQADISRNLQSIIKLATKGSDAKEIIPVLLTSFPKAVHVTVIRNVHYSGEGTFNDWVYTYVASEKNKFLLASPFLDYNSMSVCEHFIESNYDITLENGEPVTTTTRQPVVITVSHTLYPAAYTLYALTGQQFGSDLAQWQEWWRANSETYSGPPATAAAGPDGEMTPMPMIGKLQSGQMFSEIQLHGKYQLALTTGNFLTGSVEFKSDTAIILECTDGKAYSLRPTLISRFELIAPPPSAAPAAKTAPAADDGMPFSFDELRGKPNSDRLIEVRVNSGMVFRGKCKTIDENMMQLDVGGSVIPISRDVTLNIKYVSQQTTAPAAAKSAASANTILDTVYEKNSTTDDWGVPGPDILNTGTITADKPECIIIKTTATNSEKTIPRGHIVRIIRHSANSFDEEIKRYAKALFCPQDMFIVDIPPGKEGRPFFKVCVDRYEYPNVQGAAPQTNLSYDEAQILCGKKGKRLCSEDEWKYACGGIEQYTYPYGWNIEKEKCNSDDNRPPEESGSRINCVSKFGGYDMVGNVFEWVTDKRKQPTTMGGPFSKCQTVTEGVGSSAKPRVGFRCCKSN